MTLSATPDPFVLGTADIGLGLTALRALSEGEFRLPKGVRMAIPDNLLRLATYVRGGSVEHAQFLERVILNFQPRFAKPGNSARPDDVALRFAQVLLEQYESETVEVIEEVDDEVLFHLDNAFPTYVVSLSPPSHFVRLYLAKLYTWSLKKGGLIIERGRRVISQVAHFITTVQFPDPLAAFFRVKDQFSTGLFAKVGGRPTKYFATIAVAGLGLTYMPAGYAGLAIAVIDP